MKKENIEEEKKTVECNTFRQCFEWNTQQAFSFNILTNMSLNCMQCKCCMLYNRETQREGTATRIKGSSIYKHTCFTEVFIILDELIYSVSV